MPANIFGPTSASSWNAKTTFGQFGRASVRCDPDCRLICPTDLQEGGEHSPGFGPTASYSRGLEGDVQKLGRRFSVLQAFGDDSQG
jgi:hypothetical protein